MYDKSDPRAQLASSSSPTTGTDEIAHPEVIQFNDEIPAESGPSGETTWTARGQNFVVAYTSVAGPGTALKWNDRTGHIVIAADPEGAIKVSANGSEVSLTGQGIVTVPAGSSTVEVESGKSVVRMLPATADAAQNATNADSYREPHPRVALVAEGPGEVNGLQAYPLADFPPTPGRFGTIFRTSTLMVNFLDDAVGPRDPEKLSPHHHDDFEQGSLTIAGTWQHHIRTPWTTRQSQWREDLHVTVEGPSLTVIPPPTIHTSQAVGAGLNLMIDLFSPPRTDFQERGWVVNAEEYAK